MGKKIWVFLQRTFNHVKNLIIAGDRMDIPLTEGEFILNLKTFKRVFIHVFSFCLHPFHDGFGRTHFGRMITHWEITIASKQSAA